MLKTLGCGWVAVAVAVAGAGTAAGAGEEKSNHGGTETRRSEEKKSSDRKEQVVTVTFAGAKKRPVATKTVDTDKDDADDFEEDKGPVDRKIHISGAMGTSARLTWLDAHVLPDGTRREDERALQVEHVHLKFAGDLTKKLSYAVQPCVQHMNEFSLIEANFTYAFHRAFSVTAGKFLIPFGQFNLRSLPGLFNTISRPLLFQSHDDRFIYIAGQSPKTFMFQPREDVGIELAGSAWLGEAETFQFSYHAYFTNGLRGASDTSARTWDDNNNGKQFGGRVTLGAFADKFSATVGASGLLNEWDGGRRQFVVGGDVALSLELKPGRRLTLRGEYVFMRREIIPTTTLLKGDEEISGVYATVDSMVLSWFGLFVGFDWLGNKTPKAETNGTTKDVYVDMVRFLGGVLFVPVGPLAIRMEYSLWQMPTGLPTAHRVVVQALLTF